MLTKTWVPLVAGLVAVACSSGPSGPPIDSNKALSALSADETKTLCDWENTTMASVSCNGMPNTARVCGTTAGYVAGFQRATCKSNVQAFETCVNKQRACDAVGVLQSCFELGFDCAPVKAQ
jgi:hypothetical protein